MSDKQSDKKTNFEQALARLERIVESIEQGKVGLEDSIKQFEEGMALIAQCRKVLSEAEMRIQQLQADGPDGVSVKPAPAMIEE